MTVFRYPLRPPVPTSQGNYDANAPTEATDYLMLRRSRINYSDNSTQYYGENLPGNNVERNLNPNVVYLAMPNQLQTAYSPAYRQVDMGVAGILAAEAIAGGGDLDSLATSMQSAAQAALPEFAISTIAQAAGAVNSALGLQGNADANSLLAISKGKVFNPFTEQVFSNMAFRTHQFQFKLLSRSMEEAREVKNIINYIKMGAVPILGGAQSGDDALGGDITLNEGSGNASRNRFMEVPDKFELKFVRMEPDGNLSEDADGFGSMHFKIHTSVCTGVQVNYTPDGQYTSFKNINGEMVQVPALNLSLSFTETRMITQADINNGY